MGRPRTREERNCPTCGVTHRGRGPYCSKVCSNKGREVTQEQKQKTSESMVKHMNSDHDSAEYQRWIIRNHDRQTDAVVPGHIPDKEYYRDGQDIWFDAD